MQRLRSVVLDCLLWTLLVCAIAWCASILCSRVVLAQPVPAANHAARLQADLDADGVLILPAGMTELDAPLVIRFGMTIRGDGWRSWIRYTGTDPYAIHLGKVGEQCYGARLDSFRLVGGGVKVLRLDQTQRIRDVWVERAKADGILIDGIGEQTPLDGVTVRECVGAGVRITARAATNGVRLTGCSLQHNDGPGLLLETVAANASLNDVVVRDCIIQGNQRAAASGEIVARGYVGRLRIDGGWVESGRKRPGIVAEPVTMPTVTLGVVPQIGTVTRRVGFLTVTGGAVVSECYPAMVLRDTHKADVSGAIVWPASAAIEWTGSEPIGARR